MAFWKRSVALDRCMMLMAVRILLLSGSAATLPLYVGPQFRAAGRIQRLLKGTCSTRKEDLASSGYRRPSQSLTMIRYIPRCTIPLVPMYPPTSTVMASLRWVLCAQETRRHRGHKGDRNRTAAQGESEAVSGPQQPAARRSECKISALRYLAGRPRVSRYARRCGEAKRSGGATAAAGDSSRQ